MQQYQERHKIIFITFFCQNTVFHQDSRAGHPHHSYMYNHQSKSSIQIKWQKIVRMMRYLRGMTEVPLNLRVDSGGQIDLMQCTPSVGEKREQPSHQEKYLPSEHPPSRILILGIPLIQSQQQRMTLCHIQCGRVVFCIIKDTR